MKMVFKKVTSIVMLLLILLFSQTGYSQELQYQKMGTFAKASVVKNIEALAIAQTTLFFNTESKKELLKNERGGFGGRKSGGGTVIATVSAFLNFADEEPSNQDYQKLADDFYNYLNKKLSAAGIKTVDWNTISNHSFYNNQKKFTDENYTELDEKYQVITVNANKGNEFIDYSPKNIINLVGFAGGKAIKAGKFATDLNATTLYMHLLVDFADVFVDADVKTGTKETIIAGTGYSLVTDWKKYKSETKVYPAIKVTGTGYWEGKEFKTRLMYVDDKVKTEPYLLDGDIYATQKFEDGVTQDESKVKKKSGWGISMGKKMDAVPVAINTTKAKYLAAAKEALEKYADFMVLHVKAQR